MNVRCVATGILMLFSVSACGPDETRSEWPEVGLAVDNVGLTKKLVGECCFRGYVRSIQLGNFDEDSDLELAVVPQTGVYLFDAATLEQKRRFDYKQPDGETLWFGLSPYLIAGEAGFSIAKLGGGYGDIGLLNQAGKEEWIFKPDPRLQPNGMVVDDVVGRDPRFFVCDRGAIYRLDPDGGVVWKVSADADYIALIRGEGSEAGIATAEGRTRTLSIWSASGQLVRQVALPFHPDGIAFVQSGQTAGFVVKSGNKVAYLDHSGDHRFTYSYGAVPVRHGPSAALVRFVEGEAPMLAIRVTSSSATGKSVLTILSLEGSRVYEEYLDGGPSLGVIPALDGAKGRLLVGEGTERLWAYEKASPNQSMQRTGASAGR
jgi:hypothetical protein